VLRTTANRAASNEATREDADRPGKGIFEAQKPRRNLIHPTLVRDPKAEGERSEDSPPSACGKADHDPAKKHGREDHTSLSAGSRSARNGLCYSVSSEK
jgi:hypothetical protein